MSGVFADNLKKERIRAGLTQADLAEILHVKKSTISLWESLINRKAPRLVIAGGLP